MSKGPIYGGGSIGPVSWDWNQLTRLRAVTLTVGPLMLEARLELSGTLDSKLGITLGDWDVLLFWNGSNPRFWCLHAGDRSWHFG